LKRKKKVMENIGMFVMGFIVCGLYLTGYLYMIKYANDSQDKAVENDKEKARRKLSKDNDEVNN